MGDDLKIGPETAAQRDGVRELLLAAFPGPEEAELVDALRTDEAWIPQLAMAGAEPTGRVVGCALLTRCWIDDSTALCLAPCAVLPGRQNTGVGSTVTRAALEAARASGGDAVVVLGHPQYYPRFGFERASAHGIWLRTPVPDDALMALSLQGGPLPRGRIRYAAPFGDL